jgi:sulfite reductase (NADPH) flavoprotein alpha-component
MFKKLLTQLHWLLGITAGTVLAIMGVTGALLSFEDELLHALNIGVVTVAPQTAVLPLPALVDKVQSAQPGKRVSQLQVFAAPDRAVRVTLVPDKPANGPGQRRRGEVRYVDPYSAELLGGGELRGQSTLQTIERIHRGMVAGDIGRAIVGVSAMTLVVLAVTGLYLRWPRSGKLQGRTWFKIHRTLKGRPFLWNLHSVAGTCVLPMYLLSSLTGLYFAYDWYRQGVISMVGATPPSRDPPKLDAPAQSTDLPQVWNAFRQTSGGFASATLIFPQTKQHAFEVRYLQADARHARASDRMVLHPSTAAVLKHERYADKSAGNALVAGIFPLHSGQYFGFAGRIAVMLSSLCMPVFAVTGWMMYLKRRVRLTDKGSAGAGAPLRSPA